MTVDEVNKGYALLNAESLHVCHRIVTCCEYCDRLAGALRRSGWRAKEAFAQIIHLIVQDDHDSIHVRYLISRVCSLMVDHASLTMCQARQER